MKDNFKMGVMQGEVIEKGNFPITTNCINNWNSRESSVGGKDSLDENASMNGLTQEQKEQSIILMNSVEGYTDSDGNVQIKIKDKKKLENRLNSSSIDDDVISVEKLEKAVTQMNHTFSDEGTDNEYQITGLSCGSSVTIFGWIHTSNYALAAAALGITGWGAAVPATLTAGVWAAAGVIGCEL